MIGFDLQNTSAVKNGKKLLEKIALPGEVDYINRFPNNFEEKVASLWAVKEAVFKALDIRSGDILFSEVELCHKDSGAPFIRLYGRALKRLKELGSEIEISISHQKDIVGAVAVIR